MRLRRQEIRTKVTVQVWDCHATIGRNCRDLTKARTKNGSEATDVNALALNAS